MLELRVPAAVEQFFFDAVAAQVEGFEAGQKVINVLFQQLQYETFFIGGIKIAHIVVQKFLQNGCLESGNRDHVFDGEDDTDRNCDEICFIFAGRVPVFHGRVDQDEANIFITLITGAFIQIK